MISDPIFLAINVCTLTVILLTVHLLLLRSSQYQAYFLLALCMFFIGYIISKPLVVFYFPSIQLNWLVASLPALLSIAPSFWLYVKGITNETPWRLGRTDSKHFYLAILGLFIAVNALILPESVLYSVVADDGNSTNLLRPYPKILSYWINLLLIITFVLILSFVLQSGYYCLKIFQRLKRYKLHLKDLFASTETKEMQWMNVLLITIGLVWLMTAVNIIWDNFFHALLIQDVLIDFIVLIMIWSISIWGLRQKPGFEEVFDPETKTQHIETGTTAKESKKYERSALDEQQSKQIAASIVGVMRNEQLYLDNELSLQKLAKHINTPANYISQTLNSTIGMNFFDFVNNYRIEAAKELLTNSSMAVIDIAFDVGFNAKSSFYKAFKKDTKTTPTGFRKKHHSNQTN